MMKTIDKIYVDGKFISPLGKQILELHNPESGLKVATVILANAQHVDVAVAAEKKHSRLFQKQL